MRLIKLLACSLVLSGCASLETTWDVNNQHVHVPKSMESPLADAFSCIATSAPAMDLRFAVAELPDRTGVFDYEDQGAVVPNGLHLAMITSLKAAGVRVVNRNDVGMIEWEIKQSMAKVLGDERTVVMGDENPTEISYRVIQAGDLLGSTHIVSGAFNMVDFNIASGGFEASVNGFGGGRRYYDMHIGLDVSVTDTVTGEVILSKGYRKKLRGYETKAGLFRIISDRLVDVNFGMESNDPVQAGARYTTEFAIYDLLNDVYNLAGACDTQLPDKYMYY